MLTVVFVLAQVEDENARTATQTLLGACHCVFCAWVFNKYPPLQGAKKLMSWVVVKGLRD
jgi:hypothetical protein